MCVFRRGWDLAGVYEASGLRGEGSPLYVLGESVEMVLILTLSVVCTSLTSDIRRRKGPNPSARKNVLEDK